MFSYWNLPLRITFLLIISSNLIQFYKSIAERTAITMNDNSTVSLAQELNTASAKSGAHSVPADTSALFRRAAAESCVLLKMTAYCPSAPLPFLYSAPARCFGWIWATAAAATL